MSPESRIVNSGLETPKGSHMAEETYWLTFRIHEDIGADARRDAVYEAISQIASKWWIEPTSFLVFQSASSADSIAAKVKAAIKTTTDVALLGKTDFKVSKLIGKADEFQTLLELIPFVKRV